MANTETIELQVAGEQTIHCAGCEQRIGNALRRLPGIQEVRASARTQRVLVRLDPSQLDVERVRAKLAQLGYDAREVSA